VEVYTQGLMDLGATLCTQRRPVCLHCPVAEGCVARREGSPERYPLKTRRGTRGRRTNALLCLHQGRRCWLVQRPATGVWAGLWSLPEFDSADALQALVDGWCGQGQWLAPVQHALTHFEWTLQPLAWTLPARAALPRGLAEGRWFEPAEALALGLPAPIRRLLEGSVSGDG
jgi:A/G-specific adenine glycosylase